MDYKSVLDLMYIANNQVWFSPETDYGSDSYRGSEDTWGRFWELVSLNGGTDSMSGYLARALTSFGSRQLGGNIYFDKVAYPDWYTSIAIGILEPAGYPMYPEQLRKKVDGDPRYVRWLAEMKDKMEEICPQYNLGD